MAVNLIDPEPLRRFADAVGINKVLGPYPDLRSRRRSPIWRWQASGGDAEDVYALLKPYLCSIKRLQAERAFAIPRTKYRKFSQRERREIFHRYLEGERVFDLAREYGRTESAIYKLIRRVRIRNASEETS
jgi:DNA-directed RNA polymerase specialized sigma24 family protein